MVQVTNCRGAAAALAVFFGFALPAQAQTTKPGAPPVAAPTAAKPAPAAPAGPAPKVQVSTTEWNFGKIWWGDKCETEIEIKNVGTAPLEIKNVKTSCGCTVAQPSKKTLAPGESDKVKLTYNSRKGVVQVSQTATIESNDPVQPQLTLQIKGEINNLFDGTMLPDGAATTQITFGQICVEAPESRSVELTNRYPRPVKLELNPLPAGAPFTLTLETIEPGQKYKLTAMTATGIKDGSHYHHATFKTDIPERPTFEFPVNAYALNRVALFPPNVVLYSNQPKTGNNPPRYVRLNYLREKPLKITEIRSALPSVTAVVQPPPPGLAPAAGPFDSHTIAVTVPAYDDLPDSGVILEIYTDDIDPKYQKILLPVAKQQVAVAPSPSPSVPAVKNGEIPRAQPATKPAGKP